MSDGNPHKDDLPRVEKHELEPHDTSFLSNRVLFGGIIGFVLLIVVAIVAASVLFKIYPVVYSPLQNTPVSEVIITTTPPAPQLQANPAADLASFKATQQANIGNYSWANQGQGIARIPIDKAMQIIAQHGVPTYAPGGNSQSASGPAPTAGSGAPAAAGATAPAGGTPSASGGAAEGQQLFQSLGCVGCHGTNGQGTPGVAPKLQGLFNSQVTLQDGSTVTADDAYIRESILNPPAKVVKGFSPLMPTNFKDQLSSSQLDALVAYVESLK